MDLFDIVLNAGKGAALDKLANQNNISKDQTSAVMSQLLPTLAGRMQSNVQGGDGLDSLLAALGKGNHQRYVDEPDLLTDPAAQLEGNKILGHLLASKDQSRQVATQVESSTGVSASIIKRILPMAATMLMGAMSKGTQSSGLLGQLTGGRSGGGLLGSIMGSLGGGSRNSGAADLVGGLLKSFLR